ncbi:MAG: rhodanese-like domain-containing protein [Candidatus Desantisbacteria bacterium]
MIQNLLVGLALFALMLISCNNVASIPAEEVKLVVDSNSLCEVIILDVRTREEYVSGHIYGSVSIPLEELEKRTGEIDRDRMIIVYCKSGCGRSLKACQILKDKRFERVKNMPGGMDEWIRSGGRIEGSYTQKKGCLPAWEVGHGCED